MPVKSFTVSRPGVLHPNDAQAKLTHILSFANIVIGGKRPGDVQVRENRFFLRVLSNGFLGLGEAYMDGSWDCDRLDELIDRILRADLRAKVIKPWVEFLLGLRAKLFNLQNFGRAHEVGKQHYA